MLIGRIAEGIKTVEDLLTQVREVAIECKAYGCIVVLHTKGGYKSFQVGLKNKDYIKSIRVIGEHYLIGRDYRNINPP